MNNTPASERLHIALAGRCNSGKSSLLNAITGQDVALVSPAAGTTTDPVRKAIELPGAGPCTIVDTPGLDDTGSLGSLRTGRTRHELSRADMIIAFLDSDDTRWSARFVAELRSYGKPVIALLSRIDLLPGASTGITALSQAIDAKVIGVSSTTGRGIPTLLQAIAEAARRDEITLTGSLAPEGSTVVLVMPQDPQAPRGRIILPQVQTLRELLDKHCTAICCTPDRLQATLSALSSPPDLVITDSQVFGPVAAIIPPEVPLTSFSVLMAGYKGDLPLFVKGSEALENLTPASRVLIAEACSHTPQNEDIGRVKIPRLLRNRVGEGLQIDIVSGSDFPEDLTIYNLVVHCGGCMFTRSHVMERVERLRQAGIPVTNYGILLARAAGILPRISLPE